MADHGDGTARILLDRHQADSVVVERGPYAFTVHDRGRTSHGVRTWTG
ncbi:hypothetical protein ACWDQL_02625 [Streptomyces olivaceus]